MDEKNIIINKVKDMFLKYGIKSVTMDDISRELGVSKKTLYQHIKDKEDLVRQIVLNELQQLEKEIFQFTNININAIELALKISQYLNKSLSQINAAVKYDLRKYYPIIFDEFSKMRRDFMYKSIIQNIKKGQREKLFRADINADIIARIHVLRLESGSQEYFMEKKDYSSKELFREIFLYHLRGICSPKGHEFLEKKIIELKQEEKND